MSKDSARGITDAAKGTALTAVVSALSYMPLFGFFALPFLPLPTVIVTARRGIYYGILSALASGLLLSLFLGWFFGIFVLLLVSIIGTVQGSVLGRKLNPSIALVTGAVGSILFFAVSIMISNYVFKLDILKEQVELIYKSIDLNRALLLKMKMPKEDVLMTIEQMRSMVSKLPLVMPALLGITSTAISFLNVVAAKRVLRQLSFEIEGLPPFSSWEMPWYFSWGYILGIASQLFNARITYTIAANIGMNFYIFFGAMFGIHGFAVISFFIQKSKRPVLFYSFLIMLILLMPTMFQFLSWIGLFDVWFNYRRLPRED